MFAFAAVSKPSPLNPATFDPLVPLTIGSNLTYVDLWFDLNPYGPNPMTTVNGSSTITSLISPNGTDHYTLTPIAIALTNLTGSLTGLRTATFTGSTSTFTGPTVGYNNLIRAFEEYTMILLVKPTGFIDTLGFANLYSTNGALPNNSTLGSSIYLNSGLGVEVRQFVPTGAGATGGGSFADTSVLISSAALNTTEYNIIVWSGLNYQNQLYSTLRVNGVPYQDTRYGNSSLVRTFPNYGLSSEASGSTRVGGLNTYSYRGDMPLLIKFNKALTPEYIRVIEGFLANKWFITSLPSNHPYKTNLLTTNQTIPVALETERTFYYTPTT
jgi:hypothetical protein